MLKQLIFQIVCMDEKDSLFEKIFLPVNDAVRIIGGENALNSFSDKQKATQMYCKIIEKILFVSLDFSTYLCAQINDLKIK